MPRLRWPDEEEPPAPALLERAVHARVRGRLPAGSVVLARCDEGGHDGRTHRGPALWGGRGDSGSRGRPVVRGRNLDDSHLPRTERQSAPVALPRPLNWVRSSGCEDYHQQDLSENPNGYCPN